MVCSRILANLDSSYSIFLFVIKHWFGIILYRFFFNFILSYSIINFLSLSFTSTSSARNSPIIFLLFLFPSSNSSTCIPYYLPSYCLGLSKIYFYLETTLRPFLPDISLICYFITFQKYFLL